ncbi:PIN domain-containing protein [Streptomyces sp. NPDC004232]|uniref:PIN domain-containing protein n=1 Tax=Streptomyces sp. NPDC004232 TaxID=3154454 RepID=UPI0033BD79A3
MIIFDTNAVNLLPPGGPRADIIRKLRQSGHHRVAVPWMVLEEMAAHQAQLYPRKHQAVVNTLAKLRDFLPWDLESSLEPLDLERFLEHWRGVYGEIFEVIETSNEAIRRGFQREAMALPPAKRADDHSVGGRDAAIWFSILEFLKQTPDEHVHFVTNNTSDFGDGTTYPFPMDEDVRGLEGRLTRLKDFNDVVSQFTKEVSGKEAEAAAAELLRSPSVRAGIAQAARSLSTLSGFAGLGDDGAPEEWYAWCEDPEVELLSVTEVTGHEIESDVWYTAKARWLLYGLAVDETETLAGNVASLWGIKILFSTRDDETPTLLASDVPASPDDGDESCMEILKSLKKRVADVAAAAKRSLLTTPTPVERAVADQIAPSLAKLDVATIRVAQQAVAQQAALINGPVQRLARQMAAEQAKLINGPGQQLAGQIVADQAKLFNGPVQQLVRQMEANRAALQAAINSPAIRHVQQIAASLPELDIATSLPKIDVPVVAYRPSVREQMVEQGDEQAQVWDAPEAPEAEPDRTQVDGDSTSE